MAINGLRNHAIVYQKLLLYVLQCFVCIQGDLTTLERQASVGPQEGIYHVFICRIFGKSLVEVALAGIMTVILFDSPKTKGDSTRMTHINIQFFFFLYFNYYPVKRGNLLLQLTNIDFCIIFFVQMVHSVSYKQIQFYTLYFIIGNENKYHVYHITCKGNILLNYHLF